MSRHSQLEQRLGYTFRDPGLLKLALTHASVAHEESAPIDTNQRLEYLGDAVLQLVLTRELYDRFPKYSEGPLTKARAKLVNRRSLAERAHQLGLGPHLILSRGEEVSGGRERMSALADTYEAVIGAIFIDGGFDRAKECILGQFLAAFGQLEHLPMIDNPKGELQEMLQSTSTEAPRYHVASVSGPDHDRLFECTVQHCGVELARGQGKSKKAAESEAAHRALKNLRAGRLKASPARSLASPRPEADLQVPREAQPAEGLKTPDPGSATS